MLRKIKSIIRPFYYFIISIPSKVLYLICLLFIPIKNNKIVFFNFFGKEFGDNPKYIALALLGKGYDLVWLGDDKHHLLPEGIRSVKFGSLAACYELLTCKVRVENIRNYHPFKKRKGQIYIQTWHGALGFKKIEGDSEKYLSKQYIKQAKYDGKVCDAIVAGSEFIKNIYQSYFWLSPETEYIQCQEPRNDLFFKDNNIRESFRKKYGISEDVYVILYAPTFRDNGSMDFFDLDYSKLLSCFKEKTGKKCILIIRMHPAAKANNIHFTEDIIDGSGFGDATDLSIASDCLISDYSSILFYFYFQNKPAYMYVNDLEIYNKQRGGMQNLFYSCPFPKAKKQDELMGIIQNDQANDWIIRYAVFSKELCVYNAPGAETVSKWIQTHI